MASLYFLSCSASAGMTLQLLACLARVHHLVACNRKPPARSSRESLLLCTNLRNSSHLGLLSYSATVGVILQLLACLARVHHSGGLQPRATREIQPRVLASLHKLEQFFTLFHTLPLHDSHLNTRLLIAKIQANLAPNKANKMVD